MGEHEQGQHEEPQSKGKHLFISIVTAVVVAIPVLLLMAVGFRLVRWIAGW
jgi:hypothetical protein